MNTHDARMCINVRQVQIRAALAITNSCKQNIDEMNVM